MVVIVIGSLSIKWRHQTGKDQHSGNGSRGTGLIHDWWSSHTTLYHHTNLSYILNVWRRRHITSKTVSWWVSQSVSQSMTFVLRCKTCLCQLSPSQSPSVPVYSRKLIKYDFKLPYNRRSELSFFEIPFPSDVLTLSPSSLQFSLYSNIFHWNIFNCVLSLCTDKTLRVSVPDPREGI